MRTARLTLAAITCLSFAFLAGCGDERAPAPAGSEAARRHRVARIAKREATRVDEHTIRNRWGIPLALVREDDTHFYYKEYLPAAPAERRRPAPADAAATYRVDTPESARLRLDAFGEGLPTQGQWRDGFSLADLDGDGQLDLVHGPPRGSAGPPVVFLGDGAGQWRPWTATTFPPGPYAYGDAAAADLDGDGHADIVLAMHMRGLTALLGDGRGGFRRADHGLAHAGDGAVAPFSSRRIQLVDWDRDGRLDVLALGEGPRLTAGPPQRSSLDHRAQGVTLYLNRLGAAPHWQPRRDATGPNAIFGRALGVGDLNGDARPDFVTGTGMLGRRDLVHVQTGAGEWQATAVAAVRPRAYVRSLAIADLDGDGRDDVAVGYLSMEGRWRSGIDVLYQRAGGGFRRRALDGREGRDTVWALAAGDVDGDGAADLVSLGERGEVGLFPGDGRGFFTRERHTLPPYGDGCRGAHLVVADLDGDGAAEIAASFAYEAAANEDRTRCPSQGGLAVWRVSPAAR